MKASDITGKGRRPLLAIEFNVNHSRSDLLHHVSNKVVFMAQTVGVFLPWEQKQRWNSLVMLGPGTRYRWVWGSQNALKHQHTLTCMHTYPGIQTHVHTCTFTHRPTLTGTEHIYAHIYTFAYTHTHPLWKGNNHSLGSGLRTGTFPGLSWPTAAACPQAPQEVPGHL